MYSAWLLIPQNVGIDTKIKSLCWMLGKLLRFYKSPQRRRPYWRPSCISSCYERIFLSFITTSWQLCEMASHRVWLSHRNNLWNEKLYICPCNVWLYCTSSSFGGHLGLYILINIPSLDSCKFTSYASVCLRTLMMDILVKNTTK